MLISESEKYSLLPLPPSFLLSHTHAPILLLKSIPFLNRPCEFDFYRLEEFDFLDKACNDRKLCFFMIFLEADNLAMKYQRKNTL